LRLLRPDSKWRAQERENNGNDDETHILPSGSVRAVPDFAKL